MTAPAAILSRQTPRSFGSSLSIPVSGDGGHRYHGTSNDGKRIRKDTDLKQGSDYVPGAKMKLRSML